MLGWWHVPELAVEAAMVVPVDPFQRGELEVVETAPGSSVSEGLGLVQADHGWTRSDGPLAFAE